MSCSHGHSKRIT